MEEEKERVKKLSEPNFSLLGFGGSRSVNYKLSCNFLNSGATALHFEAFINAKTIEPSKNKYSLWPKQESNRVEFTLELNNLPETIELKLKYSNELDERFEKVFIANKHISSGHNIVYKV